MPLLNRRLRDSRQRPSRLVAEIREVADHENLRMRRNAHIRLYNHAARAIEFRSGFLR